MSVNIVSSDPERTGILAAIRDASLKTGADFSYLLSTAMRESGLNAAAKAKSSSATGLYQFIDQTWLGLVKRFGARHGLQEYAGAIAQDGNGRYSVASADTKSAILSLRKDAGLAALMAGESAKETQKSLECTLGREVRDGELYAAHFLGPGNAKKLIFLNESNPECCAADEFPAAARANKSVFYNADGSAKTVGEVHAWATGLPEPEKASGAIHIAPLAPMPERLATIPMARATGVSHTPAKTVEPVFQPHPLRLPFAALEILAAMTAFVPGGGR